MNIKLIQEEIDKVKSGKSDELNLAGLGLTEVPDEVYHLKGLKKLRLGDWRLHLNENSISVISEKIINLENLEVLHLEKNSIARLPDNFWQLRKIKYLYLEDNKIKEFPSKIAMLPSLKYICLTGNPIVSPQPEIAYKGLSAIQNYYEKLNMGIDVLNESKLILVGEGRVGKTSLTKSLIDEKYNLEDEKSTEGIEINYWMIKKDGSRLTTDFKMNIWDFGGQEIYHSTHQFFLTKRAVYILVTENRKEDSIDVFYYWLNLIKLLGNNSPTIIVLNKCDQPIKDIPIGEYRSEFANIVDFVKISCHPKYKNTVDELKFKIRKILENALFMPHVGTPLPKPWLEIRRELEEKRSDNTNYISLKEYYSICNKYGEDNRSADYLSDFFHDLGVFLHFPDDVKLKDTIFLNHEWVTTGVYKLLDNEDVIRNYGKFDLDDLNKIWCQDEYQYKQGQLLALLDKFEICFKLSDSNSYLAPNLLPVDAIDVDIQKLSTLNEIVNYEFRYKFMPKGILSRFIVKNHEYIFERKYWRFGVVLKYEDTYAYVHEKYFERKIIIKIVGRNKRDLLTIVRKGIRDVNNYFSKLEFQEMIPCNCKTCRDSKTPSFFRADLLQKKLENKKIKAECEESLEDVSIHELLGDLLPEAQDSRGNKVFIFGDHNIFQNTIIGDQGEIR